MTKTRRPFVKLSTHPKQPYYPPSSPPPSSSPPHPTPTRKAHHPTSSAHHLLTTYTHSYIPVIPPPLPADCNRASANIDPQITFRNGATSSFGTCTIQYQTGGAGDVPIFSCLIQGTARKAVATCPFRQGSFGTGNLDCETSYVTVGFRQVLGVRMDACWGEEEEVGVQDVSA